MTKFYYQWLDSGTFGNIIDIIMIRYSPYCSDTAVEKRRKLIRT